MVFWQIAVLTSVEFHKLEPSDVGKFSKEYTYDSRNYERESYLTIRIVPSLLDFFLVRFFNFILLGLICPKY